MNYEKIKTEQEIACLGEKDGARILKLQLHPDKDGEDIYEKGLDAIDEMAANLAHRQLGMSDQSLGVRFIESRQSGTHHAKAWSVPAHQPRRINLTEHQRQSCARVYFLNLE